MFMINDLPAVTNRCHISSHLPATVILIFKVFISLIQRFLDLSFLARIADMSHTFSQIIFSKLNTAQFSGCGCQQPVKFRVHPKQSHIKVDRNAIYTVKTILCLFI